ncbi:MAG: hypothetical protein JKX71_11685 [Amylibacter sp.]|nr:hypothetical protein [Amylibacter sp.]
MTVFTKILRKYKRNDRGAIMLELVVLMPVLLLWLVGSNAFFDAFKTYLRASKASYTAVDLISRQEVIGPNYMRNVASIFESIVDSDGASPTIVASSIQKLNGDLVVHWSVSGNGGGGLTNAAQIPTEYIPNLVESEYVILLQTSVPFIPVLSWAQLQSTIYTNTIVVTPRFSARVSFDPNL